MTSDLLFQIAVLDDYMMIEAIATSCCFQIFSTENHQKKSQKIISSQAF